jgi:4-amino-4-deoxy-L-arabinose transferase-like glycosyltransferase
VAAVTATPDLEATYRALLWVALLAAPLIYFWGIWSIPILSHDEARRMVVVQEMMRNHNWLLPTLNGRPYLTKPPLYYWCAGVLATLLQSTAEWVLRLPSALAALAVTWLTFAHARRTLGLGPAVFAALILCTSQNFTLHARRAEIDMLFTCWCTLAAFLFHDFLTKPWASRHLYGAFAALGLAVMTKGPVAFVFVIVPLVAFYFLDRERRVLRGLLSPRGWLCFVLTALPWFLYAQSHLGGDTLQAVVEKDIVGKSFGSGKRDPLWSYPLEILGSFSPWLVILLHKPRTLWGAILGRRGSAFFACLTLVPLAVMSLFAAKHGKYILPLFPACAVLLGAMIAPWYEQRLASSGSKFARASVGALVLLVTGWFVHYAAVEPSIYRARFAALKPLSADLVRYHDGHPVYSYPIEYHAVVYYFGRPIPALDGKELKAKLAAGESFLLISTHAEEQDLEGLPLCTLAEHHPFLHRGTTVRLAGSHALCGEK